MTHYVVASSTGYSLDHHFQPYVDVLVARHGFAEGQPRTKDTNGNAWLKTWPTEAEAIQFKAELEERIPGMKWTIRQVEVTTD